MFNVIKYYFSINILYRKKKDFLLSVQLLPPDFKIIKKILQRARKLLLEIEITITITLFSDNLTCESCAAIIKVRCIERRLLNVYICTV